MPGFEGLTRRRVEGDVGMSVARGRRGGRNVNFILDNARLSVYYSIIFTQPTVRLRCWPPGSPRPRSCDSRRF